MQQMNFICHNVIYINIYIEIICTDKEYRETRNLKVMLLIMLLILQSNAINTIQGLIVSRLAKKLCLTPGKVNVAIR